MGLIDSKLEQIRIELARQDVNEFCEYALEWKQADCHRKWQQFVEDNHTCVVLAPRYHGKTSQISVGRTLWLLGRNPNLRIKIISMNDARAASIVSEISQNIEKNEKLHKVFPHLIPADRGSWTSHRVSVQRDIIDKDCSLECYGILSGVTGGRADVLIFDDPVDFRNAISQPALREVVKEVFRSVWVNLLDEGEDSRLVYIGTAWHQDDLTHELLDNEKVYPHLVERVRNGVLWPEKWGQPQLDSRRAKIGDREFDRQFNNEALTNEETLFPYDILKANFVNDTQYGSGILELDAGLTFYTGVDLAIGKTKSAAFTVIFTLACTNDGIKIPVEIKRGKWRAKKIINEIANTHETWKSKTIYVENNAFQQALIEFMEDDEDEKIRKLPLKGCFTGDKKFDPYMGLPAMALEFEKKKWAIYRGSEEAHRGCKCTQCVWLDELSHFPVAKRSDTVMASFFAFQGTHKRFGRTPRISRVR